jgi:hypothetical protein
MAKLVIVEWVDLGKMKIQNWGMMAMIRNAWNRIVEQAKTHKEL